MPANSPYEVIRFASREDGIHALIIFREPGDPKRNVNERADKVQKLLASKGFSHFARAETMIQSGPVLTLDFDRPHEENLPLVEVGGVKALVAENLLLKYQILEGDRYVTRAEPDAAASGATPRKPNRFSQIPFLGWAAF